MGIAISNYAPVSGGGKEPLRSPFVYSNLSNGLRSYHFVGIGWLLHTGWDSLHHAYGNPLLPFDPTSSLGWALYDPANRCVVFRGRTVGFCYPAP